MIRNTVNKGLDWNRMLSFLKTPAEIKISCMHQIQNLKIKITAKSPRR